MSAFKRLSAKLAAQGVRDPDALAATVGRAKYGPSVMARAASKGVPAASIAKKQRPSR